MSSSKKVRVNLDIRAEQVRLIGADGEQVGIVGLTEALAAAKAATLDLVEISPNAEPPVCRIMDHGKQIFQAKKQKAEAKRKQKRTSVKEIKFRPTIEDGDYQVKLRNLIRFLQGGDKVKVTLRFRGREMTHQNLGMEVMLRVRGDLGEFGVVEQEPKLEGRQIVMVIGQKRAK